jgi:hypothetical protein
MGNPLSGDADCSGSALKPGDVRTWSAKDKSGNVIKSFKLTRTTREYVYDLCDAYNEARTKEVEDRGVEWFVAPNGELRIGTSDDWSRKNLKQAESRNETGRARHNRLTLEAARRANAYQDAAE